MVRAAPLAGDVVSIRVRCDHIREDIISAQQKVERIQLRIERDRRALAVWQTRLAGIDHENHSGR
jgi:hypothetical protein